MTTANPTTPAQATTPVAPAVPDEKALKAELDKAMKSGDWKAIAKVAGEIAKLEKAKEDAAKETALKALQALEVEVKTAIEKAIQPFIDSKKLDSADGVWYTHDFGEKLTSIRFMKGSVKKTGTSGVGAGVGKKFDISTEDLMTKYGDQVYKDGQTFKVAWEADVDKNKRFSIRKALLKLNGNT